MKRTLVEPPLTGVPAPTSEEQLDEYLSRPSQETVTAAAALDGDVVVLGAGGKIGYSVSRMLRRSLDHAGRSATRVIAVSRFSTATAVERFEAAGIETIAADLLDDGVLESLPDAKNVLYLAGMKFGSSGNLPATWAMNTFLPGLVARRYAGSRIVALSTGNVYPLVPVASAGSVESDRPEPVGEYAESCLGRERIFAYYSERLATPVCLIRLNYANALRYGVLVDVGLKVAAQEPVDVTMGYANVIWQGDANAAFIRAFDLCSVPPDVLNVSGPEKVTVRGAAARFAQHLGAPPLRLVGVEAKTALLSDCSRQVSLFGPPSVPLEQLVEWTASWIQRGGRLLNKPTGFQVRDGRF